MSHPAPRLVVTILLAVGVVACGSGAASISPAVRASPTSRSAPSADASGGASPSAEAPAPVVAGQTDSDWGRIWDSLPARFPIYPGSTPAEEAAKGPASGVLAVQGGDAHTIVAWVQSKLEQATYSTEALTGPLEDGSFVLEATGPEPGCRVQVWIAPLGGLITETVLYGADCPEP
jgi:hypothetical protein